MQLLSLLSLSFDAIVIVNVDGAVFVIVVVVVSIVVVQV